MDLIKLKPHNSDVETRKVVYSFFYFFSLMSGYFILRPVRDEMGILAGIDNLQWLFTLTFLVMLLIVPVFGFLMKKIPRWKLVPLIYIFFTVNILIFFLLFQGTTTEISATIFFVWLSVFNVFVISIFWSFNSDIFNPEQAKRLYGPIAAGGSTGAIVGPLVTSFLVGSVGIENLLLISGGLLLIATFFVYQLIKYQRKDTGRILSPTLDQSIWSGLKVMIKSPLLKSMGIFILLYSAISTFIYFEQAHIVSQTYASSEDRTIYFGTRDLLINSLTLILQFFFTEKMIKRWGIGWCLMIVPLVAIGGFIGLGLSQSIYLLLFIQVIYRSIGFAVQRPARELVFTSMPVVERYKSKNIIDTAIYRGGDALGSWLFVGLTALISSVQIIAFVVIPIAVGWAISGRNIGKLFNQKITNFYGKIEESSIAKKSA